MSSHAIIYAQAARGIIPSSFVCACCGSELDRDDHMKGRFLPEHEEELTNRYGPNVCFGCADDFNPEQPCPDCGREVCACDDAYEAWVSEKILESK